MKTSTTLIKFALVIILVSSSTIICNALGDGNDTFDCKGGQATAVTGNQGFLSIKRGVDPCVFESKSGTKFFVIQTDNLDLKGKDSLTVEDIVGNNTKEFEGAQEEGYIVIGLANFALKFAFDASIKNESVIKVRFFQDPTPTPTLPVSGDRKRDLVIQNIGQLKYNLGIEKSIADPVYLDSVIARRLILKGSEAVPVEFSEDKVLSLSLSPALNECSGYHATKDGETVDIQGPDVTILNKRESYKCVHLFESSDKSHHDVDFKNFAGMLDDSDELSIIDASGTLKVTRSNQAEYNGLLSAVSSKDQKLAVVYDSPEKISRIQAQFKLSVHTRLLGGVIDKFDSKLDIPSKGSVIYSLRTPPTGSVVNLEFDKLSGVQMKIYNRHNQVFSVDTSTASLTTSIPFDKPNGDISVEFSAVANKKISGSVNYKPGSDCSGTLFESSGTIAFKGTNKTCYWFLGAQTNLLNINLNDLEAGGSLEIYAGGRLEPIFHSDNMASTEVLPPMVLENPAYLKIKLGSPTNSFGATLSPVEKSQASSRSQATITSIGYPNSYQWSANPESYSFNFTETKNKEFVLSVADLDLRPGETMTIDSKAVASDTVPVDIDLKTKTINMSIQRSYNGGFSTHRGYKLVTTAFDQLIVANMTASVLTTPQNLTSVLIRIPGGAKQRISYTITATNDTNQVIQVIDSKSLMGRQATDGLNSSSTSNELLVSVRSSNPKTTLPQIKVEYSQTPCDEAKDHMCDGSTRCVPADKMCKGVGYCADGSDLKVPCSSGSSPLPPPIPPKVIETGVGGVTVFILSVLMFSLGAVAALYGPDLYKNFQTRFRSGQYTTFQSTE